MADLVLYHSPGCCSQRIEVLLDLMHVRHTIAAIGSTHAAIPCD